MGDRALPYAPLQALLRTDLPTPHELAGLIANSPLPAAEEGGQTQRRLFERFARSLVDTAHQDHARAQNPVLAAPRLLVFEDLHWCDEATLE